MSPSQPCCLTPQITTIIHSLYILRKNCKCKNKRTRVDILPPAFTPKGTSLSHSVELGDLPQSVLTSRLTLQVKPKLTKA